MNQVSLSTTAGKVFWASLIAYCLTFSAFYYNTQYTLGKVDEALSDSGILGQVRTEVCAKMVGCKDIAYSPYLIINDETKKYVVEVGINIKHPKDVNEKLLNSLLDAKRTSLPDYVNQKIDSFSIVMINGNRVKAAKNKPYWYVSLISKLGV